MLLADIFSTCFGWESIKDIRDTVLGGGARIDPKFVNNPELSDVQFRVEGRLFYGHKIVLVTWSPRFRAMLSSKPADGSPPVVHINDIRYHIFQVIFLENILFLLIKIVERIYLYSQNLFERSLRCREYELILY